MSLKASRVKDEPVPVARPAQALQAPLIKAVADVPVEEPALTPEAVKSWATSLTVHGLILLAMALWYIAPRLQTTRVIDTRLMGSEMGVEEGLTATGGLNTEFEMPLSPDTIDTMPVAEASSLESPVLDPQLSDLFKKSGSDRPSAAGGVDNPNPGAGNGDGFGLARFGEGGESIRGIEVRVGDPQFTLLWDTPVDLDLHVIEPGGKEIYWEDPKGRHGGELDVDNTKGYGPENIYWLHEDESTGERVKGMGPAGEYRWFVVYWGGFGGTPIPTRWKVRIKHAGKVEVVTGRFRALNERSKMHTLKVDAPVP